MVVYLKHHYGWEQYRIKGVKSIKQAAYKAVLKSHDFLNRQNHRRTTDNEYVYIIRNEKSNKTLLKPFWYDDSIGSTWFSVEYSKNKQG